MRPAYYYGSVVWTVKWSYSLHSLHGEQNALRTPYWVSSCVPRIYRVLAHKTSVFQWFSQRLILSFRRLCGTTAYNASHIYVNTRAKRQQTLCIHIWSKFYRFLCVILFYYFVVQCYTVIHRRVRTHTRATILLLLLFVIRQSVLLWCKMYAPVRWLREWVNQFQSPFVCVSVDAIVCVPKQKAIFWLLQLLLRNEQTTERNETKERRKNRGFFFALSSIHLSWRPKKK